MRHQDEVVCCLVKPDGCRLWLKPINSPPDLNNFSVINAHILHLIRGTVIGGRKKTEKKGEGEKKRETHLHFRFTICLGWENRIGMQGGERKGDDGKWLKTLQATSVCAEQASGGDTWLLLINCKIFLFFLVVVMWMTVAIIPLSPSFTEMCIVGWNGQDVN